jgi:hypothetical protein
MNDLAVSRQFILLSHSVNSERRLVNTGAFGFSNNSSLQSGHVFACSLPDFDHLRRHLSPKIWLHLLVGPVRVGLCVALKPSWHIAQLSTTLTFLKNSARVGSFLTLGMVVVHVGVSCLSSAEPMRATGTVSDGASTAKWGYANFVFQRPGWRKNRKA